MEKDVGKIKKNETTDIIVRIDDFGGKRGLTIREFVTSEKYTGFTKSGTRIPAEEFLNFRDVINSVSLDDLTVPSSPSAPSTPSAPSAQQPLPEKKEKKPRKTKKTDKKEEEQPKVKEEKQEAKKEVKEEEKAEEKSI